MIFLLYLATAGGLACLLWRGERLDRWAVLLFVVFLIAEPIVDPWRIQTWRIGPALLNLVLFLGLWALAERASRWWLVLCAALQLIAVVTHLVPIFGPAQFAIGGVIIRRIDWLLIVFTLYVGAWESWAAKRFAREGRVNAKHSDI